MDLAQLKNEMLPPSIFEEMNKNVWEENCWEIFRRARIPKRRVAPTFSVENVGKAQDVFRALVRKFLQYPIHEEPRPEGANDYLLTSQAE